MPVLPDDAADADRDDPLATISQLRECWIDLVWDDTRRLAVEARRDRIVERLHTLAVARLRGARRPASTPRSPR